ncbi:MAG: hypothetical protein JWP58_1785 [Hymenobacter sp.]|nr:hypothetical protein [Hymenobacter sp.]
MESNARFVIGVFLEDPKADPLVFLFQQALFEQERIGVAVPRAEADKMGPSQLAGAVTDYYLQKYPEEIERVGRGTVLGAVERAMR